MSHEDNSREALQRDPIGREALHPGESIGPYRIESFVAAGGMGQVYRATDTRLHREVAVKVCSGRFSERFAQEARVIASLNHPHICHLYDAGPNYLVMELVEGTPLRGPLPVQLAMEYAGQVLDALAAAHRKGVTHRDLKPANILVTRQGIKLPSPGGHEATNAGSTSIVEIALCRELARGASGHRGTRRVGLNTVRLILPANLENSEPLPVVGI